MEELKIDTDGATVRLSKAEIGLVNNALNEVANGVDIAEFEFKARLGESREAARQLLREVGAVIERWDRRLPLQVVIALKPGTRLAELARLSPIWAARAPETERLAEELRAGASSRHEAQGADITLFNAAQDAEADLAWVLDEVELHHGLASDPESPVAFIRIVGAELTRP